MSSCDLALRISVVIRRLAEAEAVPCFGFAVPLVKQDELVWCWAAVGLSLLRYFGINDPGDQCGVASLVLQGCQRPCNCANCIQTSDIEPTLGHLKLGFNKFDPHDSVKVEAALKARQPIVTEIAEATDEHLVIIHGYCPDTNDLTIMDTRPGYDTHQWSLDDNVFLRSFYIGGQAAFVPPAPCLSRRLGPSLQVESLEPEGVATLLARRLPALLARNYQPARLTELEDRGFTLGDGLGINVWSSKDVLAESFTTSFLGWRHILFSGEEALMAIDLVRRDGRLAFKKASIGPCVPATAEAMRRLARKDFKPSQVALVEVPCLATTGLLFVDPGGEAQLMTAYSPFPEFEGYRVLTLPAFVVAARERAIAERITSHV